MAYCSICGREITDEQSIKRGIGPECHMRSKKDGAGQGSLFGVRASYDYGRHENVIIIWDNNSAGYKSVTNDIENVLQDISEAEGYLDDFKIIYMDHHGMYDGVKTRFGKYAGFFPIQETDMQLAIKKALA